MLCILNEQWWYYRWIPWELMVVGVKDSRDLHQHRRFRVTAGTKSYFADKPSQ